MDRLGTRKNVDTDSLLSTPLGQNWLGDTILRVLVDIAILLFIVTIAACYLGSPNFNPKERLEDVL